MAEIRDIIAEVLRPDWFGPLFQHPDGSNYHPLDNYPNQHQRYQEAARLNADRLISALESAGYTIVAKATHGD